MSERVPLIAGNWKMNLTPDEGRAWCDGFKARLATPPERVEAHRARLRARAFGCLLEVHDLRFGGEAVHPVARPLTPVLRAAGYDRFQIVNQALHNMVRPVDPPREGRFADAKFNGHMSGLFGLELPPRKWIDAEECLDRYLSFRRLKQRDGTLCHGWIDFHATTQRWLDNAG